MPDAATLPRDGEEAPITERNDDTLPPFERRADAESGQPAGGRVYAADPHPWITLNLSDYSGGPVVHLLRSRKFKHYDESPGMRR